MADYGLLGGIAEGLKAGFQSYKDTKKEAVDQAIKEKMLKMEELKTAGDLSEKLGYLPKGYFSPETIKALGATDGSAPSAIANPFSSGAYADIRSAGTEDRSSDSSGLLEGPQNPADKYALVKPGMVDPNAAPQNPSVPEGSYAIPGTLTKKQRADRDELNKFNVQLNPQGKAAKFDAQGNVMIVDLPKTEKQTMEEKKKTLDIENAGLEADKKRKDLAKPDEPKESQFKAATFANRAEHAQNIYAQLEEVGFDPSKLSARIQAKLPAALESFKSNPVKLQELAERDFISGVLRRESGAAISPAEFQEYGKMYFPRAGDSAEVKAEKAAARKDATDGLKREASSAYRPASKPAKSIVGSNPKPKSVTQGGHSYMLNEKTGEYE